MTAEGARPVSEGYPIEQQFLYADYSPLGDHRNIIEMLKNFVSLTGRLIQFHTNNEKLASLLNTAESIRQDVIRTVNQIKTNTQDGMNRFHNKYPDALATDLHTSSTALLDDGSKAIFSLLGNTEAGFAEQYKNYTDGILSRIQENHASAFNLVQSWLAGDYKNFPKPLLSSFSTEVSVNIESAGPKAYTAYRKSSSTKQTTRNQGLNKEKGSMGLSYKFRIETSELEFWRSPRRISEFGVKDLLLPVGMKATISEKIKQAFRFGSSKNDDLAKEPDFVKVDDFYLLSSRLVEDKTLTLQIVGDLSKPDLDLFDISFDLGNLSNSHPHLKHAQSLRDRSHPKLNYKSGKNGTPSEAADLLHVKEIAQASDFSKIYFCGTAILEKLKILQTTDVVVSTGQLELKGIDDDHFLTIDGRNEIEFPLLFDFLNFVASSFAPFVKRLKERTPVGGELILRQEVESGKRTEFSVRLDDLKSQLPDIHYCGKKVSDTLQL